VKIRRKVTHRVAGDGRAASHKPKV
jgi:hypothetical protein